MPTPLQEAQQWLREFETACRGRDFDTGRRMFADDAVAFGTWAMAVHGLANIERERRHGVDRGRLVLRGHGRGRQALRSPRACHLHPRAAKRTLAVRAQPRLA